VTGEKLEAKQLIKINFHKNAKDEIHCPITFKVLTDSSYIVAIRPSGNVYSYDAIERLNIKTNTFNDLLTNEPFTRNDIITIQDPKNLDKFNIQSFAHLKNEWKLDDEDEKARRTDPNYFLKYINNETAATLQQIKSTPSKEFAEKSETSIYSTKQIKLNQQQLDHTNMATYSTGRLSASFTSTSMDPVTIMEAAIRDENEIRYARIKNEKKKGYVRLITNLGVINIELDCDLCPQTCENFIKHCADKYYAGSKFHRSIKNFIVSTYTIFRGWTRW
jgi:peptidyl-prolyl cis-trans isomerase-like protein 2